MGRANMSRADTVNQAGRTLSVRIRRKETVSSSHASSDATPPGRRLRGRRVYEYQSDSWWSNLLYGLGALVFMVVPPLLPGTTVSGVIMGYIGFLALSYGLVCVWGVVRALRTPAGLSSTGR